MPHNLRLLMLPPYSPELNPAENLWDELREKSFHNRVFDSLDAFEITWKQHNARHGKRFVNVSNLSLHSLGL
ncbi:transposase [Nitrosomonas communis]|uniref:transposase n=1 Tax=Nitrosomonas communis TaxID=44574 RepID=UPI003CC7B0B1